MPLLDGSVTLSRADWWAVMTALAGDKSQRDRALDVLQRWAPPPWLDALDEYEMRERVSREAR